MGLAVPVLPPCSADSALPLCFQTCQAGPHRVSGEQQEPVQLEQQPGGWVSTAGSAGSGEWVHMAQGEAWWGA